MDCRRAVAYAFFFSIPCVLPVVANAAHCTPPERHATAADLSAMASAGIPNPVVDMCWDPNGSVGLNAGQAKEYLNSLPKRPLSRCAPPTRENIMALNDTFAICAAGFFKAYVAAGKTIYITSAFRDGRAGTAGDGSGRSANECAGGAANSNHTRGVAMDVNPGDGNYPQLWEFAKQNPRFGVCFPHRDGTTRTNYPDRPHMVLAGIGGNEGGACTDQGVVRACNGLVFTPGPLPTITTPTPSISQPTAAISNMMRNMFAPPPPPIIPSQPIAPYYDPTQYFSPPPVTPTTSPITTPAPSPSPAPPPSYVPPPPPTSTTIVVPTSSPNSSSSITLISDIGNIAGLDVGTKPKIVGTTTVAISSLPQNTFVSGDLRNSPSDPNAFHNKNVLYTVLEAMKRALLRLLDVLKPFGTNRHPMH